MTPFQLAIEIFCKRHGMTDEGAVAVAKEAADQFPHRVMPVSNGVVRSIVAQITEGAA